jgi:two-component system, cell cycle response regulator CpdR
MTPPTRVLIVDDEESVRTFLERALRLAGYDTAVAANGPEALRIWHDQGPFELLLADVVMPGMPGNEVARQLRVLDPDLKVLYFTGYSDRLFIEKTTLWENEAFIEKPVNMSGLLEAVSLILFGHVQRLAGDVSTRKAQPRSARVATAPLQVQIAGTPGRLVNVSATGALVRVQQGLALDHDSPMQIDVDPEPVELRVRVVRSHSVSIPVPESAWQHQEYAVALAFTDIPSTAKRALKTLCGDRFSQQE